VKKVLQILGGLIGLLAVCGIYDVSRNKGKDKSVVKRYFTGNGILTWLLSPLNSLLDILSLPYVNKGIYKLEDLPEAYQKEISSVLDAAVREDLVAKLEETAKDRKRTMVFFKWYGENVENSIDIPDFHQDYKFVKTIGVSIFSKRQSTSKHFGPFRATLRVLYNINQMDDDSAYITVGDVNNYWRTDKLFIFDDTLMHQSFNETEQARYCMFIDILRPSLFPALFTWIVATVRYFLRSVNFLFYKNWDVVKG
jgi:aspartyl/asparaginyl beta-hydroxylase (cupin superfamily)